MEDLDASRLAWPMLGLRVRTGRLELRLPRCTDLVTLTPASYHAGPDTRVGVTFTPSELLTRELARSIAEWSVDRWTLIFGAFKADGRAVGIQCVSAEEFPSSHTFTTPVWVAPSKRGLGYATEMREAVLFLMFNHLRAVTALASPQPDNIASIAISLGLGYASSPRLGDDATQEATSLYLSRESWLSQSRPEVRVEGISPCLPLFGFS